MRYGGYAVDKRHCVCIGKIDDDGSCLIDISPCTFFHGGQEPVVAHRADLIVFASDDEIPFAVDAAVTFLLDDDVEPFGKPDFVVPAGDQLFPVDCRYAVLAFSGDEKPPLRIRIALAVFKVRPDNGASVPFEECDGGLCRPR